MKIIYINANLKHLRKLRRITQTALSESVGLSRDAITSYEKDENPVLPPVDKAATLADYFHISLDNFVLTNLALVPDEQLPLLSEPATDYKPISPGETNGGTLTELQAYIIALQKNLITRLRKQIIGLGGVPEE